LTATIDPEANRLFDSDANSCSTCHADFSLGPSNLFETSMMTFVSPVSIPSASPIEPLLNGRFCPCCFATWSLPKALEADIKSASSSESLESADSGARVSRPRGAGGSLAVVGLGIRPSDQLTEEVRSVIRSADRVVYLTDDESPLDGEEFQKFIRDGIEARTSVIEPFDASGARASTQKAIDNRIDEIIELVRKGEKVCIVTYGHPAVLYSPTRKAVEQAMDDDLDAIMLPAISSLDCLFADLLIDPVAHGLQVFDSLGFLTLKREVDASVSLALMVPSRLTRPDRLLLIKKLEVAFPEDPICYLYQAAASRTDPDPSIDPLKISELADKEIKPGFILFIRAKTEPAIDEALAKRIKNRRPKK
jgi:hypothetical protein